MTEGRRRLLLWMDRSHWQDKDLAAELKITPAYTSQLLRGRRRPGLDIAAHIFTLTGIPMDSWVATSQVEVDSALLKDRRRSAVGNTRKAR